MGQSTVSAASSISLPQACIACEGSVTATIAGFGTVNVVEGTVMTAHDGYVTGGSVQRPPDGVDTNNAAADRVSAVTSPGAPKP